MNSYSKRCIMEGKRLPRREREKLSHRNQILADALELFTEKGYHNVSMHEIAAKAEFSIGTLYKYFKSKEDLYSALIIEKAEAFSRAIDEVLSGKDDIENMVREYVNVKIRFFKENLVLVRLFFAEMQGCISFGSNADFVRKLRGLHQKEIKKVASLLEKGIRMKKLKKLNPYHLSVTLGGIIDAFMHDWLENQDDHLYEANASFVIELFFNGCLNVKETIHLID
jgi:TetR/AcrR family transcriptional regulator